MRFTDRKLDLGCGHRLGDRSLLRNGEVVIKPPVFGDDHAAARTTGSAVARPEPRLGASSGSRQKNRPAAKRSGPPAMTPRLLRSHLLMIRNSLLDASRHMSAAGSCQMFSRTWTCSALHDTPGTWSTDRAPESSPRVTRQRPSSGNRALFNVNGGGWLTVLGWVCLRSIWNRTTIHWVSPGGKHPSSRWVASRKFLWCGQSNASGICFRRWR